MIYISGALVFISILVYDIARRFLKLQKSNEHDFIGGDVMGRIQELEVRVTSLEFKKYNEKSKI
jgi:hypothetical protein